MGFLNFIELLTDLIFGNGTIRSPLIRGDLVTFAKILFSFLTRHWWRHQIFKLLWRAYGIKFTQIFGFSGMELSDLPWSGEIWFHLRKSFFISLQGVCGANKFSDFREWNNQISPDQGRSDSSIPENPQYKKKWIFGNGTMISPLIRGDLVPFSKILCHSQSTNSWIFGNRTDFRCLLYTSPSPRD